MDELSGAGHCGLCVMEEDEDKEKGDKDEGELEEEGGEGVCELETDGEPTLSEADGAWCW